MLSDDPAHDQFQRDLHIFSDSVTTGCFDGGVIREMLDASRRGALSNPVKVLYLASFELFLRACELRPPGDAS